MLTATADVALILTACRPSKPIIPLDGAHLDEYGSLGLGLIEA
jgi:hypothetical protein